jgi:hypothetical protein
MSRSLPNPRSKTDRETGGGPVKVFISWSGDLSLGVAKLLRGWLPKVIQALDPYVSSEDINKGARWFLEISKALEESEFGIICTTHSNKNSPWLLFEAGALAKHLSESLVSPFLIDIKPSDLSGPMAQFQATKVTQDEVRNLLTSINRCLGDSALQRERLEETLELRWPELSHGISAAQKESRKSSRKPKRREDRELLEEVLRNTRSIMKAPAKSIGEETPLDFPGGRGGVLANVFDRYLAQVARAYVEVHGASDRTVSSEGETRESVYPGLQNLTAEHSRVLSHLYYEQGQTLSELAEHSDLPANVIRRLVRELHPIVRDKHSDGHFWATVTDKAEARRLAAEAAKERGDGTP